MKFLFLLLFFAFVLGFNFGCKKVYPTTEIHTDTTIIIHSDTTIIRDTIIYNNLKQIGYNLPTFNTSDTSFIPTIYYSLKKFNVDYFPKVDSVFYSTNIVLGDVEDVEFELYDITDDVPITGSKMNFTKANANTSGYYQSGNIAANFPHKEISLGISMHSKKSGAFVGINDATLFVYMK